MKIRKITEYKIECKFIGNNFKFWLILQIIKELFKNEKIKKLKGF